MTEARDAAKALLDEAEAKRMAWLEEQVRNAVPYGELPYRGMPEDRGTVYDNPYQIDPTPGDDRVIFVCVLVIICLVASLAYWLLS